MFSDDLRKPWAKDSKLALPDVVAGNLQIIKRPRVLLKNCIEQKTFKNKNMFRSTRIIQTFSQN